jgi:hypothetical protein
MPFNSYEPYGASTVALVVSRLEIYGEESHDKVFEMWLMSIQL